jgi:6-pyruvoyl-tetrahydropterin synthase
MSSTVIPTNVEIKEAAFNAEQALEETKKNELINKEGKKILNTTEHILQQAVQMVEEKNPDDLIQRIISEAKQAGEDLQNTQLRWTEFQTSLKGVQSEELRDRLNRVYETAKFIALELLTSASFRQTLYDFFAVFYSVLVDASEIERIGRPLKEAIECMKNEKEAKGAGQKLKEATEQAVSRVIDYKDPQKPFFRTENLTREQVDQLVDRAYDVLQNISKRERSERFIQNLVDVWDLLRQPLEQIVKQVDETAEKVSEKMDIDQDPHIQEVMRLSRELFERMTGRSMDLFLSHWKVIYRAVLDDPELKKYFSDLRQFIISYVEDKEKPVRALTEEQERKQIRWFIEEGRRLVQKSEGAEHPLRENFRALAEEVQQMIYAIEDDPLTQSIQNDLRKLVALTLLDDQGRMTFKPEVLDQLRIITTSLVLRRLRFPLPPISFGQDDKSQTLAFTVSGMVLNMEDLLPKKIVAENQGLAILNLKTPESPEVTTAAETVRIFFKNINVHLPNAYLKFDYRGFPQAKDEGRAYIDIPGRGLDIAIILESRKGSDRMLGLRRVDVNIHELSLKLEGTRHDTLYNAFVTVFKPRIKTHIENAMIDSMEGVFDSLNDQLEQQAKYLRDQISSAAAKAVPIPIQRQ